MATSSRSERFRPDVLLVDGRHLLYRAADVGSELSTEVDGDVVPTGGIHGFLGALLKIKRKYSGVVVVAWEGRDNFRKKLYPAYKRRAQVTDLVEAEAKATFMDALSFQEAYVRSVLALFGVRQFGGVGGEADDVIGTLAASLPASTVGIYTGDSDLRQLVDDRVRVIAPGFKGKETVYDTAAVYERHGVGPKDIALLKALMGDKSDGIPGIPGVGEKTAAAMIQKHGGEFWTIENMAVQPERWALSERYRLLFLEHREAVQLYEKLTTIRCDLPLVPDPVDYQPMKARGIMARLNFNRLLEPGPFADLKRLRK